MKKNNNKSDFIKKLKTEHVVIFTLLIILLIVIILSAIKGGTYFIADKTSNITTEKDYIAYSHEYNKDNVYGEEQTPNMENYSSEEFEAVPIACWGDEYNIASNTYTPSMAAFLSRNTERIVFNMAIDNCSLETMGGRQGGLPMYVMPCDIPAKKSSVEVVIKNDFNDNISIDFSKNAGLNPCSINDIEGVISEFDGTLKFTRNKSGFEDIILKPTVLTTRAMTYRRNDITVFFLGNDTSYSDINKAINIYDKMVSYLETDKYLIIGPITGNTATVKAANDALSQHFGNKFFNLYDYLLNVAPDKNSITLSSEGKEKIQNGVLPDNYFSTNNRFNKLGAEIAANIISDKLKELKYIN
ncbi:MAG: hypothetical protein Q4D26_04425 [Clostridia bacterium]|nr:hypothetical protein [Clostridia bacterium]